MLELLMRKFILISFIAISVIIFSFVHKTYSTEKCTHECITCHKITNDDAVNLLKEALPDVKVNEIRPTPIKGLWEVDIESKGRKGLLYVDFSKNYIVSGAIIDIKTKANLTQERFSELNKIDVSQIPLDDAIVMGDKNAKHHIIVFSDPD
jgi:thiol:disulfide interchange protein DsbC